MDDQKHIGLFRLQLAELTQATAFCPEEQEIAEYFDDDLAEAERKRLERHLADCRFCLARVGMLGRLEAVRTDRRIPGAVLATARQMRRGTPARRSGTRAAWATAAVLIVALFTVISQNLKFTRESGATPAAAPSAEVDSRQLRNLSRFGNGLDVLTPNPGADVSPGSSMQWSEVTGSLHYDIFILSYAGDVVWTERLADPEWVLLESLKLAEDSTYYLRVDAHLQDGRTVRSKHVAFRLTERQ